MGLSSRITLHAWHRHAPDRQHDHGKAQADERRGKGPTRLSGCLTALLLALPAGAEPLRIATFNTDLDRDGPGLFLRDLLRGGAADIDAAIALIVQADADILLLQGIDWDARAAALTAFRDLLEQAGAPYPHQLSGEVNRGLPTDTDRDGDGFDRGPGDAHGWARFRGQGGMAVLSRHPLRMLPGLTRLPWADLPGTLFDPATDRPADLRLSTTGHWIVEADTPSAPPLRLLAYHATPPVFDDAHDVNGRRNHDEAALWRAYLDGRLALTPPDARFVILGGANLDPLDGDGRPEALARLLTDPRLTDPRPASPEGRRRAAADGGANDAHRGNPALDTADWRDGPGDPGNLRVDYILPSADLPVLAAGIAWAEPGPDAPRHGLVWVEIETAPLP